MGSIQADITEDDELMSLCMRINARERSKPKFLPKSCNELTSDFIFEMSALALRLIFYKVYKLIN